MRLPAGKLACSKVGAAGGSPARHIVASLQALGARSEPLKLLRHGRRQRQAEQDADNEDSEVCREHVLRPGRQTVRYKTLTKSAQSKWEHTTQQPGWQVRLSGCEEVGELFQSKRDSVRVHAESVRPEKLILGFERQQKK